MISLTLALVVFLFPLAWSPGPGNLLFAANGARFGLRATVPANLGYHVATWGVTVLVGFGFAGILARTPWLFDGMRWVGAVYVLWLAARLWSAGIMTEGAGARPLGAMGGAFLLVTNPKAWVIVSLMFTQFLSADATHHAVFWIATVFTLNNMVAFAAWTALGDRLGAIFRDGARAVWLNRGFATVLAGVGVWILIG
ncbi:MAG: LysE family translocator [Jannaschia sp.]